MERAYHYWFKASNYSVIKKYLTKALIVAEKLKHTKLRILNDQSIFISYLASLYSLNNKNNHAFKLIKKAIDIPHKLKLVYFLYNIRLLGGAT